MNRQGHILVVDDVEMWHERISRALQGRFQVEAVRTLADAHDHLNTNLYHVLILDIRMNEKDRNNVDGLKFLQKLHQEKTTEAIKVIMLSALDTNMHILHAFRDYKVADFLSKVDFNKQAILEAVQRVFTIDANINLSLEVHWKKSGAAEAALNLNIGGNPVKRDSESQKQGAEELEDLLCRLFKDAQSVSVQPLTPGYSGAAVLYVQPFYETGGAGRPVVVKFGDVKQIEEEYEKFKNYVQYFLGGCYTVVFDVRYTPNLGGIIYNFLGSSQERLTNFGEFYRQAKISEISKVLNRLFDDTCRSWYASRQGLQLVNLTDEYQHLLGDSVETLEHLPQVHGRRKLSFGALKDGRTFTNPIWACKDRIFKYPTYLCTTHGDFNPHNLLVDSEGHAWLIDFQKTGKSHILRDVTMLDSTIRFQLLATPEDATLEECLYMEEILCSIKHFSEVKRLPSKLATTNPALVKAYGAILHLYKKACKLVSQNPNDDVNEYYCALFYHALNTTRFATLSEGQREHALLCASLLADKLGMSS